MSAEQNQDQEQPAKAASIPDRTPPSMRGYRKRVHKTCVVCSGPFLIATPGKTGYQTCSAACSTALRSRQRAGRPLGRRRKADGEPKTRAERQTPNAKRQTPNPERRADVELLGRGASLVTCVRCAGERGRWGAGELPPPGLCWLCLMRRNAGLDPGMPPG